MPDLSELSSLTVAELRDLAARKKVALVSRLKADIVKELRKTLKPKKKSAAKKVAAKKKSTKTAKPAARTAGKKAQPSKETAAKKYDLKSMTVAGLKALAQKKKVGLKSTLKADIIKELQKALAKNGAPAGAKKKTAAKKKAEKSAPMRPEKKVAPKKSTKRLPQRPATSRPVGTVAPSVPGPTKPRTKGKAGTKDKAPPGWLPVMPPERAGDNWVSAIPVEPGRIFVSWDLMEDVEMAGRRLVLRVTEARSHNGAGEYIQVPIENLNGGLFVSVFPGRDYVAVIGTMGMDGDFIPIISTQKVDTPSGLPPAGESLLGEKHFLYRPGGKGRRSSY